jgi:hypothetical protein
MDLQAFIAAYGYLEKMYVEHTDNLLEHAAGDGGPPAGKPR